MSDVRTACAIPLPGLEFLRFLLVREVFHDWTLKNLVFTLRLVLSPQKPLLLFLPIPSQTLARLRPLRIAQVESIGESTTESETFLDLIPFCSMELGLVSILYAWRKELNHFHKVPNFSDNLHHKLRNHNWGDSSEKGPKKTRFFREPTFQIGELVEEKRRWGLEGRNYVQRNVGNGEGRMRLTWVANSKGQTLTLTTHEKPAKSFELSLSQQWLQVSMTYSLTLTLPSS